MKNKFKRKEALNYLLNNKIKLSHRKMKEIN